MATILSRKGGGSGGGGGALPSWWTIDSTPGSESVEFAGAVEIEPGRDVSALVLRADPGQTEHIMRVYNEAGDLSMDIDADGRMDVISYIVQVPPDTGVDSTPEATVVNPGEIEVTGNPADAGAAMLKATRSTGLSFREVFRVNKSGAVLGLQPMASEQNVCVEIVAAESGAGNAIEMWDFPFNNTLFELRYDGGIKVTLPTANPGAGLLWSDSNVVKVGT